MWKALFRWIERLKPYVRKGMRHGASHISRVRLSQLKAVEKNE